MFLEVSGFLILSIEGAPRFFVEKFLSHSTENFRRTGLLVFKSAFVRLTLIALATFILLCRGKQVGKK